MYKSIKIIQNILKKEGRYTENMNINKITTTIKLVSI